MLITVERPREDVRIAQPKHGFRYSVDAFWLAGFAMELAPVGPALDLCTGCGIVAHLLAAEGYRATGIDIEAGWQACWAQSRCARPPTLRVGDARSLDGTWPLVTCNPPYRPLGSGPAPKGDFKAAAHQEHHGTLDVIWEAARRCSTGWTVFVLPRDRVSELPEATRRIDVGRRRTLLAWHPERDPEPMRHCSEADAERWVARARGAVASQLDRLG